MSTDWAPAACTLPTAERPFRLAEFDELVAAPHRTGPYELSLGFPPGRADDVRDLVRRESECCSFFTFTVHEDRLDVTVPPAYAEVLDALESRLG